METSEPILDNAQTQTNTNPNTVSPAQTVEPANAPVQLTKAELDRMIQQAVRSNEENAKKKAEKELAEKTMTESQKLQALADELRAEKELLKREKAEVAAKAVLTAKGLTETDYGDLLESIVSEDTEATKAKAEKIGDRILALADSLAKKTIQEQMKNTPTPDATLNNTVQTTSLKEQYKVLAKYCSEHPSDRKSMEKLFALNEQLINETR